jgi:hypothetical protein
MATQSETRVINETLFEQLGTPGLEKRAIDAVNDFTRVKMREDGFFRRIIPPLQISNDDLDRQVDTDKPVKVVDKEPDSPAAISLPFASLPINIYIKGPRYRVLFDRVVTPRFTKDVDELRTWVMDIRQVLSDNAIKDMLAEEDSKFLTAVNVGLVGQDTVVPASGVPQWQTISGGITRDTLQDAFKIMPRTPSHLEVHTVLINNVTIREVMKWGRDEMGGDFSQDLVKNGWSEQEFMNARWIITIKRDLVPDDSVYMFSDPKFIGKSYLLEDTTMYIKREAFMLEFFAYETMGAAIGNTSGLARADFV